MKNESTYKSMYFLGIGGIGMSALARYYAASGVKVSGYDRTATPLTRKLEEEGISIHYTPDVSLIPANLDIAVYTPAVPTNNPEFQFLQNSGVTFVKRSKAMADLVNDKFCIAIAGTHGKTTISSLTTHILKHSGNEVLAFVGGLMKNYGKNIIFSTNPRFCVVEADEYDRSFLNLKPDIAVISTIDADHLDIYENFDNMKQAFASFAEGIKEGGKLITHHSVELSTTKETVFYGIENSRGLSAQNIRFEHGEYKFDILQDGKTIAEDVLFPFAGLHNVENALAATQVALFAGISIEKITSALATFQGIHRRFDFRIKSDDVVYIDDYAHHPREIDALIKGVRNLYPSKEITGIFQPHLFSRTKDFAKEFAESLEKLDTVIITDIYPARELPIEGIDAQYLLGLISHPHKYYCKAEEIPNMIHQMKPGLLLTIGAGDIDKLVQPLTDILNQMKEDRT
jgi:UDP-N-acetylmuramate--alanine ligase